MRLKVKILDSHHTLYHKCSGLYHDSGLYVISDPNPRKIQSNCLNYLANELGKETVYGRVLDMVGMIVYSESHEVVLETEEEELWKWNKFLTFSEIKC